MSTSLSFDFLSFLLSLSSTSSTYPPVPFYTSPLCILASCLAPSFLATHFSPRFPRALSPYAQSHAVPNALTSPLLQLPPHVYRMFSAPPLRYIPLPFLHALTYVTHICGCFCYLYHSQAPVSTVILLQYIRSSYLCFLFTGILSGLLFQFTCSITHSCSAVFHILMTRAIHTTWFCCCFPHGFGVLSASACFAALPSNSYLSCTFRLLPWFIRFTRLFSSVRGTPLRWRDPFFLPRLYEVPLWCPAS